MSVEYSSGGGGTGRNDNSEGDKSAGSLFSPVKNSGGGGMSSGISSDVSITLTTFGLSAFFSAIRSATIIGRTATGSAADGDATTGGVTVKGATTGGTIADDSTTGGTITRGGTAGDRLRCC